jgi:transposase-like protein
MTINFRLLRWFFLAAIGFGLLSLIANEPVLTFLVLVGLMTWMSFLVKCPTCGKSPYVRKIGPFYFGQPIPETQCSKCGRNLEESPGAPPNINA